MRLPAQVSHGDSLRDTLTIVYCGGGDGKFKNRFSFLSVVAVGLCYSPVGEQGMLLLLDSEKTLL